MSRKNIENIYALSPMQQGILFHALYANEPGVYLVALAWTLHGDLDAAAFARAWQAVCDRHAVLRTAFAWERLDRPVQIVRKRVQLPIEQHDLTGLPPDERAARAAALEAEIQSRGFDLTRAPLLRLGLIRTDDKTHRLVWSSAPPHPRRLVAPPPGPRGVHPLRRLSRWGLRPRTQAGARARPRTPAAGAC